jgi:hypothetical protein
MQNISHEQYSMLEIDRKHCVGPVKSVGGPRVAHDMSNRNCKGDNG